MDIIFFNWHKKDYIVALLPLPKSIEFYIKVNIDTTLKLRMLRSVFWWRSSCSDLDAETNQYDTINIHRSAYAEWRIWITENRFTQDHQSEVSRRYDFGVKPKIVAFSFIE